MPRINDAHLNSIVYLYNSEEEANKGSGDAATGFLLGSNYWYREHRMPHLYVVTNAHVIETMSEKVANSIDKCIAIRINTRADDKPHFVYKTQSGNWSYHSNNDDIAICSLHIDWDNQSQLDASFISRDLLVTKDSLQDYDIGVGTDVYMIGQFKLFPGKTINKPTVRIGHIALMPDENEKIEQDRRIKHSQESFILNCRSDNGFSGSPVFIDLYASVDGVKSYNKFLLAMLAEKFKQLEQRSMLLNTLMSGRVTNPEAKGAMVNLLFTPPKNEEMIQKQDELIDKFKPRLLGVNWGHYPARAQVRGGGGGEVIDNTDFSCTVPAWKLIDLLDKEHMVNERDRREEEFRNQVEHQLLEKGDESDMS